MKKTKRQKNVNHRHFFKLLTTGRQESNTDGVQRYKAIAK